MKKFLFIGLLLLAAGCGEKKAEVLPADVLPEERFVPLLTDMMILEAVYKQRMLQDDESQVALGSYLAFVYEKHGATDAQFKTSFAYWSEHPEDMMRMYDKCLATLDQMEFPASPEEEQPANQDLPLK